MKNKLILLLTALTLSACSSSVSAPVHDEVFINPDYEIIEVLPHSRKAFTEGLFFYDGQLYETSGLYGESFVNKIDDISTGHVSERVHFPEDIFAEGATVLDDRLFVLTYKEGLTIELDALSLDLVNYTKEFEGEGWGLTNDGNFLIVSNGTNEIRFYNTDWELQRSVFVTENGDPVMNLNELEFVNGKILANVWQTNDIVIINPENGNVERRIDFTGLVDEYFKDEEVDTMNGIAFNSETEQLYITGKYWSKMFEISVPGLTPAEIHE